MTQPVPMAKGHVDPANDTGPGTLRVPAAASPGERLVARLLSELAAREPLVDLYDAYYEGRHRLTFVSSNYRRAWGQMIAAIGENWCNLVVEATVERLGVVGFNQGERADTKAWDIWRRNGLDDDIDLAFSAAAKHGEAYLLVEPDDDGRASITIEHARQMIVTRAPGNRRKITAALKRWWDADYNEERVTVWTAQQTVRLRRGPKDSWFTPRTDVEPITTQRLGEVPVAVLVNEPSILPCFPARSLIAPPHLVPETAHVGLGRSDLADVIATQDVINTLVSDLVVAAETQAYRQRWATGLEVPRDPTTGQPIEPFKSSQQRLWVSENKDTKFGDFPTVDLGNYLSALDDGRRSISSRTRIPVHVLMGGSGNWPSGQSLRAAETGLVTKVRQRHRYYNYPLLQATNWARRIEGGPTDWTAEIDWIEPETRIESEYADSLIKQLALGVPPQVLYRNLGYSQTEIDAFAGMWQEIRVQGIPVSTGDSSASGGAQGGAPTPAPSPAEEQAAAGAPPAPAEPVAPIS